MRIDLLGIPVDSLTMDETVTKIDNAIISNGKINHVVINAGKVVSMQTDEALFNSVVSCDIINADGQSIVWASRFLGKYLPERVAGVDLMQELVALAALKNYTCYFLGASENVVQSVVRFYTKKYGPNVIAGYRNGYFTDEQESEVANQIFNSHANFLFVAMSSPKKENFLFRNRAVLSNINFTMGVGGSFDVIAGIIKRAPKWIQNIGMEWFFRFLQEPSRLGRRYFVGNFMFLYLVFRQKLIQSLNLYL